MKKTLLDNENVSQYYMQMGSVVDGRNEAARPAE